MWTALMAGLAMALLCGVAQAAPELIVDVDFNDEVYTRDHPITEAETEQLIRDLHANGAQTLLLRCGYLGYLPYRTKLSYPIGFDEDDARKGPNNATTVGNDLEAWIARRKQWNAMYAQVIEDFNPPEVFIRVGHELGMKVLMWLDVFDDGYPGYRSKFLTEHPECQWTGRDGRRFQGVMSYAFPEARAFRVAQAKELLDLGADGIHCSTSCHSRHRPNVHEVDYYGYEEPIVDAFRTKYGVDILQDPDFSRRAWQVLKGEAMNELYRELGALCHARGKALWVGLQMGDYTTLSADPHFSDNAVVRYANNWRELVNEGIADAFIVGDYELCSDPNNPYWRGKPDIRRHEGEDLFAWAAREYGDTCRGKTKLYLFSEWLPSQPEPLEARMAQWAPRVLDNGFDGIDVHEACNFEGPGCMAVLKRFAERLNGGH
jgi:hypothetical protein